MSKGLSQMSRHERQQAIERRLKMSEAARGLGYWAALDAKAKQDTFKKSVEEAME